MPRLIKRYANRRLYDVEAKKSITLQGLAELIKEGHEVKVIDNRTKEDITLPTLFQVLSMEAREWKESMPSARVARELIAKGGETMAEMFKKAMLVGADVFFVTKERVEELVDELIKRGQLDKKDRALVVRELLDKVEGRTMEVKKWVDERVRVALSKIKMARAEEVEILSKQVADLKRVLSRLERKMREGGKKNEG